jgi:crotonobetainyl-CoA:carnitine CoA-transferase CaiB-like acyl-CoA transferase
VRILDVSSDSLAVAHCTSILGLLGHDVIKVESAPDGDPLRRRPPTVCLDGASVSLPFVWSSRAKHWVSVPADATARAAAIRILASAADVVLANDIEQAAGGAGRLLTAVLSPFGSLGARAKWRAGSFALFHASGPGFVTPRAPMDGTSVIVNPQAPWGYVAEYFAGTNTAAIVLAYAVKPGPRVLDLSMQQMLLPLMRREVSAWQYDGRRASRRERLWRVAPSGYYRTRDGWCYVNVIEDHQWTALCRIMGNAEWAVDPRLLGADNRFVNLELLSPSLEDWFAGYTSAEIFEMCGQAGVPVGPANDPRQLLASAQLAFRQGFAAGPDGMRLPQIPLMRDAQRVTGEWTVPPIGRDDDGRQPSTSGAAEARR